MTVLKIGFDVPFDAAIEAAVKRSVVLPDIYYGELQGISRQLAFSIKGITAYRQLEAVRDSLALAMNSGQSFKEWKKLASVENLRLPEHRVENIWRTNLQGNYMRGRWRQFASAADKRPFLMYDAINDTRVRPSHLAHDGVIRGVFDPYWSTHTPPLGYQCRCTLHSLTLEEATKRSGIGRDGKPQGMDKFPVLPDGSPALPDSGWDYNPFEDELKAMSRVLEEIKLKSKYAKIAEAIPEKPAHEFVSGRVGHERLTSLGDQWYSRLMETKVSVDSGLGPSTSKTVKDVIAANVPGKRGALNAQIAAEGIRKNIRNMLRSARKVGGEKIATDKAYKGKLGSIIKRVSSAYPDDFVRAGNRKKIEFELAEMRGKYIQSTKIYTLPGSNAEHEYAHHLQWSMSQMQDAFDEFHNARTRGHQKEVLYSKLPNETGRPDGYFDRYCGREYEGRGARELMAMTFQAVFGMDADANRYLADLLKDEELSKFVLGVIFHYKP